MRLLADENLHRLIVAHLRDAGHEVISISELAPGIADEEVLEMTNSSGSIQLTGDKDFGELAFRQNLVHHGIVLLRLAGLQTEEKVEIVLQVLKAHDTELEYAFTVVTPNQIRIRKSI